MKEAVVINKSLSALGNVVMALQRSDYTHVPYRDSKLTRLLQDSLGGNSYTTVLATLNPLQENYEECLNTLMFANRCRYVQNSPQVNYVTTSSEATDKRIKALMTEIGELRDSLSAAQKREGGLRELLNNKIKLSTGNETLMSMLGMTAAGEGKPNPRISGNAISDIAVDPIAALVTVTQKVEKKAAAVKEAKEENRLMQQAQKDFAEKNRADVNQWRAKVKSLEEALEAQKRAYESTIEGLQGRHGQEMETAAEGTRQLVQNLQGQLRDMPTELRANAKKILDAEQAAALAKAESGQDWSVRYEALSHAKDTEMQNMKEKFEFLLESKGQSLRKFVNEYEEYKAASEQVAERLRTEVQLLYEYTEKLTHVMERVECGMYPVRDRGGIKSMLIPPEDKPGKMPIERCHELQRLLGHATNFTRNQEERRETRSRMASAVDEVASLSLDELRDEVMRLRANPGAGEEAPMDAGVGSVDTEGLRHRLEEEVLTELSSHPTVAYIRGLEEESSGYRDALKSETKRTRDQRVALESKDRIIDKLREQLQSFSQRSGSRQGRPSSVMMDRSGRGTPVF